MESSSRNGAIAACRGNTLIEVLVAMSILSLGLSGLGAMQFKTLQHLRSVVYLSRANLYSADMAERLRSIDSNAPPGGDVMARWRGEIEQSLPLGEGGVCIDSTPQDGSADAMACDGAGEVWAIKIWWDDDRDGIVERAHVTSLRP